MKRVFINVFLGASIVLSACKKETVKSTEASVNLTALTYFKDNHDETRTDRSGAWSKTSYYSITGQNSKLFVNLGEQGTTHTQAIFGLSFLFNNKNIVDSVTGSYTFPASNQFIKVVLRNQIAPGRDEVLLLPVYGKVSFSYDAAAKQVSGKIENLEFNVLGNYPFDRNKIIINGTFKKIGLK